MTFGSFPLGSVTLGGTLNLSVAFDLEKLTNGKSIVQISDIVARKLFSHFEKNPQELKNIDRRLFEKIVAELFKSFGFSVELTQQTRDGGKDIIAISQDTFNTKYLIECKRPNEGNKVNIRSVRELHSVKNDEAATKAILVTTAYFTKDAKFFLEKHKWELEGKEYNDLMDWIIQYNRNIPQ